MYMDPDEIIEGDWFAVIGIWRRQVRDGEKITIVGDGEQRRDFTHVDDIVSCHINISCQRGISTHEGGVGIGYWSKLLN